MINKYAEATNQLKKVSNNTNEFLRGLSGTSENLSKKDSQTLIGTAGGIIGTIIGIIASTFIPGFALIPISTALTALGMIVGIIGSRGFTIIRIERKLEESQKIYDDIIDKINKLPKNETEESRELRSLLYNQLIDISKTNHNNIKSIIEHKEKGNNKLPKIAPIPEAIVPQKIEIDTEDTEKIEIDTEDTEKIREIHPIKIKADGKTSAKNQEF
ncbi:hypothetical protein [Methylomagnum ishizawai]|uniref:hypothetical protein n=1 Tax=Methylomagnum ishizawai TaxID=1760988 RepID=UPI001C337630|nr:hypothetical protein [Methylomagnum ishizawai]BBL75439.1 hypothetical protein MishRS11D_25370 [Methylomagnum ishizawai]